MDAEPHYEINLTVWIVTNVLKVYLHTFSWSFLFCSLVEVLLMNPDLDIILSKIFNKQLHRFFFTHSAIFPIAVYYGRHEYLNMATAKEYVYILFIPVIAHMFIDYSPIILKKINGQWKLKIANPIGTWLIFIVGRYRLNKWATFTWAWSNIIIMCIYIYLV